MSYLTKCEYKRTRQFGQLGIVHQYAIKWRGTSGQIYAAHVGPLSGDGPDTLRVYYKRYSTLGARLGKNDEQERHFIFEELRKAHDFKLYKHAAFFGL